jgi:hypothetical protein
MGICGESLVRVGELNFFWIFIWIIYLFGFLVPFLEKFVKFSAFHFEFGQQERGRKLEIPGLIQGRREGVKGVTVSRGPDRKRGPGNHKNKRKTGWSKEILLFWGPNLQVFRALKLSGPRLSYLAYTKLNLQVERGPKTLVSRGSAGLTTSLD